MKTFDRPNTCPYCGIALEAVTNMTSDLAPKEGDITLCDRCLEPCRFDDRLRMVKVEWSDMPPRQAAELRAVVQLLVRTRRPS